MDLTTLIRLNEEIPVRENAGDRPYFEARLAPALALRRRDGTVLGRQQFLDALSAGGDRQSTSIGAVTLLGTERALVSCVVTAGGAAIENVRLFIRDARAPEGWLLLAWANEAA